MGGWANGRVGGPMGRMGTCNLARLSPVAPTNLLTCASHPTTSLQEPLIHTVEYVSVARKDTMEEIEGEVTALGGAVLSLALRLGKVRLIDNVLL